MKIVAFIVVAYLIQVKVGFNMNIGDLIFQLVFLIFTFVIFSGVFFFLFFLSLLNSQANQKALNKS
ncbi:hypothetical protein AM233_05310 [Bacillus sp. FJAT-22058]|nr:hypothetical protein AM233_05310 [Bacillus sp. FJAT-22058]